MSPNHEYLLKTKSNLRKRFWAGLIDYGLIFTYFFVMLYLYGEPNTNGEIQINGWPAFSVSVVWFILTIGIEQLNGVTLGNRLMNLIAVPKDDPRQDLTFLQSLKRHLLDPIDMWPFGLLGILLIKNTEFNQRLGDLWAKTIVLDKSDINQELK